MVHGEGILILDGFQDNKSELQPDTVIGDTQAQSEPVFALSYLMGHTADAKNEKLE